MGTKEGKIFMVQNVEGNFFDDRVYFALRTNIISFKLHLHF